jgi:hypothetical protein
VSLRRTLGSEAKCGTQQKVGRRRRFTLLISGRDARSHGILTGEKRCFAEGPLVTALGARTSGKVIGGKGQLILRLYFAHPILETAG